MSILDNIINGVAQRLGYSKKVEATDEKRVDSASENVRIKREILPWDKISEGDNTMNYFAGEAPARAAKESLKSCTSWVYSCVSAICDEVASMTFHLYRYKNGEIKEIEEHEILNLLLKVNQYTTRFDHFWLTQEYLELIGEAPWLLDRGENADKPPTSIWLLRPDKLTVLPDKDKIIGGYKYTLEGGKTETTDPRG